MKFGILYNTAYSSEAHGTASQDHNRNALRQEGKIMAHSACTRFFALMVMTVVISLGAARPLWAASEKPQHVRLTWMSVTNWLFEVGTTRILMDGYITRIPEAAFSGVGFATATPTKPDELAIRRLLDALGDSGKIDFILTGHSHYDHSFDTAPWATNPWHTCRG